MTIKRPSAMSIQAFLSDFDKRLFKTKTYGTTMSDDIFAYQLLKEPQTIRISCFYLLHNYVVMSTKLK